MYNSFYKNLIVPDTTVVNLSILGKNFRIPSALISSAFEEILFVFYKKVLDKTS